MRRQILSLAFLGCLACSWSVAAAADFRASAVRDAEILAAVAAIAQTHTATYPDEATQSKIKQLLSPSLSVEELARLAKLAWAMGSGLAENDRYDSVFDFLQWHCLEQISRRPGPDAAVLLEHVLKPVMGDDGHASEEFREFIRRQRELSAH